MTTRTPPASTSSSSSSPHPMPLPPIPGFSTPSEFASTSPAALAMTCIRTATGPWRLAPHLSLINRLLLECAALRTKLLMVFLPPRHGKSELISHALPVWWLGTFPEQNVMLVSYGAEWAEKWGRDCRDTMTEYGPQVWGHKVRQDSQAANRWQLAGHEGSMVSTGIGGAITGRGADLLII